jgi:hypothetical protein
MGNKDMLSNRHVKMKIDLERNYPKLSIERKDEKYRIMAIDINDTVRRSIVHIDGVPEDRREYTEVIL